MTASQRIAVVSMLAMMLLGLAGTRVPAQALGWSGEAETNASLFFGNTSQWLVAARGKVQHRDSTLEARTEANASYARAATDSGTTVVSARAWFASVGLDYHPLSRWSPFVLGSAEANLQQQLHRRYSAGLGAKYTIIKNDAHRLDASVALLVEHTEPSDPAADTLPRTRARWSARLRIDRKLNSRLDFSHATFYQPSAEDFSRFTLNTTTVLGVHLNRTLALTVTLRDNCDSEAKRRGARSNTDGQFLLGLRAAY